jgi:hypothetical protein
MQPGPLGLLGCTVFWSGLTLLLGARQQVN